MRSTHKLMRRISQSSIAKRRPRRGETGFTLVELSVAMLIFAIFMVMVISAMVHLVNPTVQTESIRDSSDQLDIAFLDLDSEVRYAYDIWAPYQGTAGNDWDIEYESTFNGAAEPTCSELRYNYSSGQLLQASWSEGATTTPSFKMLAEDLTGSSDPFQVIQNSSYEKVQLMVTLSAASGNGAGKETTSSSVTFTALNSTSYEEATSADTQCTASWTGA
jgi:prepilin-type N-terminal cleavage/methylation domain-containing protein